MSARVGKSAELDGKLGFALVDAGLAVSESCRDLGCLLAVTPLHRELSVLGARSRDRESRGGEGGQDGELGEAGKKHVGGRDSVQRVSLVNNSGARKKEKKGSRRKGVKEEGERREM